MKEWLLLLMRAPKIALVVETALLVNVSVIRDERVHFVRKSRHAPEMRINRAAVMEYVSMENVSAQMNLRVIVAIKVKNQNR